MKNPMFALLFILTLVGGTLYFSIPVSTRELAPDADPKTDTPAPKFALLVGVNDYKPGSNIPNLSGTHNDVALMKSLLAEYGFKEELKKPAVTTSAPCGDQTPTSAVKTLCSAQATKQAIIEGFRTQLIKNAEDYWKGATPVPSKGPTVVFYFSGHGSKVPDVPPLDEADGYDETLVPYDSDRDTGVRDILDDEIDVLLTKLKNFTTNITFFADSCHSGTIIRGGDGKKGFERNFPNAKGERETPDSTDNMSWNNSYVAIEGSRPTEYSYEADLPDPVTHADKRDGLLTYHFVNLLRQNPGATYSEIMNLVRKAVSDSGRNQTPQFEGDVDRSVFGSAASAGKRPIFVKCKDTCSEAVTKKDLAGNDFTVHKITMDVGTIVGAREGGPIVIYAPKAKELSGDADKIASGNITAADAFSSEAEVTFADPLAKDLPPLAKVVLISPGFSDTKRIVAIDIAPPNGSATDPGRASMQRLSANLKDSSYLSPTEKTGIIGTLNAKSLASKGKSDWEVAVVRATYADFKLGMSRVETKDTAVPADTDSGYFITNRTGMPLYNLWVPATAPIAAEMLQDALEKHVKAENLRALGNEASELNGKVKVEMVKYKDLKLISKGVCKLTEFAPGELKVQPGRSPTLKLKDPFALRITNTSDRDFLIYILSIDARSKVDVIYPPRAAQERLEPGVPLLTNANNACGTFWITPGSAYGKETIKVLLSDSEIPVDLLKQQGIKGMRSGSSPLERMLIQAAGNTRATPFEGTVGDWTAVNFDYIIVP